MLHKLGFTLMELLIVLIIIGVVAAFTFTNFTIPTQQAQASTAWNNLLAIYSAQQNYSNNNNNTCPYTPAAGNSCYCLAKPGTASPACQAADSYCADSLAAINCNLSLNIQDDGTYTYKCELHNCTATGSASSGGLIIKMMLNKPIQLNQNNPNPNPTCTPSGSNLCP